MRGRAGELMERVRGAPLVTGRVALSGPSPCPMHDFEYSQHYRSPVRSERDHAKEDDDKREEQKLLAGHSVTFAGCSRSSVGIAAPPGPQEQSG